MIGRTIEQYRIDREIGQGRLGTVFQATDTRQNKSVALKIIDSRLSSQDVFEKRFMQEARAASQLDHPNIIHVYNYDYKEGVLFLVMEYVNGGTMRDFMTRQHAEGKAMPFKQAADLLRQLADALHYASSQQDQTHRELHDVRPESILLAGSDSNVKPLLTEFGLARLAEDAVQGELSAERLAYLSPEQCSSKKLDVRADIYSLGVLLFELTAGVPPFSPQSFNEAVRMHTHDQPPSLAALRSGFPLELEKLIRRALEKNPNDRYQTANEFSRALQKFGQVDEAPAPDMKTEIPADAPASAGAVIEVSTEGKPTRQEPATKMPLSIGRAETNAIRLDSGKVSREHATVNRIGDGSYTITDLGSANGTRIEERKIAPQTAEKWDPNKLVKIGEFSLRLIPEEAPERTSIEDELGFTQVENERKRAGAPATPAAVTPAAGRSAAAAVPAPPTPPPMPIPVAAPTPTAAASVINPELIGLTVENTNLTVDAGNQIPLSVQVTNQSALVDHFEVQVVGLPEGWVTQPATGDALQLFPKEHKAVTIVFHPPKLSSSAAGAHPFELKVTARAQEAAQVTRSGVLNVNPFYLFTTNLSPKTIKRRKAKLTIENKGNAPGTYVLSATDRENELNYDLGDGAVSVPAGGKEVRNIRITPQSRQFFGMAKTKQFDLAIDAGERTGGTQHQPGDVVISAVLPPIALTGITAALIGIMATIGIVLNLRNSGINLAQTLSFNKVTFDVATQQRLDTEKLTQLAMLDTATPSITPTPSIEPTNVGSSGDICINSPSPSDMTGQPGGMVLPDVKLLNVRTTPGVPTPGGPTPVSTYVNTGDVFVILDTVPRCGLIDKLRWWYVNFYVRGMQGWVAEGNIKESANGGYYLAPDATPPPPSQ